ncbi:uncharacterized protein MYCFIDRAFT_18187, partial [Pseudocercospora fijiensis CIRAD86]
RGFCKMELTCWQARYHELRFAWVDTCCIDESSSAELSEAINSISTFASSRRFTRGWTLQELLAPRQLRFFDAHWTYFGDQKSLSRAAGRKTTPLADIVHCLLGIFDFSMPLSYRERHRAFHRLQEEILLSILLW